MSVSNKRLTSVNRHPQDFEVVKVDRALVEALERGRRNEEIETIEKKKKGTR